MEDTAGVDRNKCLGCGLCASDCPTDAIRLVLRPDREELFDGIAEMGREILKGKQANAEKVAGTLLEVQFPEAGKLNL